MMSCRRYDRSWSAVFLLGRMGSCPRMSDAEPGETFFIAACTGPNGFEVIASRIRRELQSFDHASRLAGNFRQPACS